MDNLLIELHPALKVQTVPDLIKFSTFYEFVLERLGFRLWWMHHNVLKPRYYYGGQGPLLMNHHPVLRALGAKSSLGSPCCYEMALRREPSG